MKRTRNSCARMGAHQAVYCQPDKASSLLRDKGTFAEWLYKRHAEGNPSKGGNISPYCNCSFQKQGHSYSVASPWPELLSSHFFLMTWLQGDSIVPWPRRKQKQKAGRGAQGLPELPAVWMLRAPVWLQREPGPAVAPAGGVLRTELQGMLGVLVVQRGTS